MKAVFPRRIFLANPSFWLVESEFLSSRNSILLFAASFYLWKPLLAAKSIFTNQTDFVEKYVSTRREKLAKVSEKWTKNDFH